MRWLRCAGLGCLAASVCGAAGLRVADTSAAAKVGARKTAQRKMVALSPWEQAEQGREALEAVPEADRTKAQYDHAIDGYRAIYHANPRDVHAAAAVNAVAELLAEQGRTLHEVKTSKAAVGQYEFLRKQYPGSSLRVQALLAEGQIEENDLNDADAAKEKYALLVKQYPKSEQAEEARAGLASLKLTVGNREQGAAAKGAAKVAVQPAPRDTAARNGAPSLTAGGGSSLPPTPTTAGALAPPVVEPARTGVARAVDGAGLDEVDAQTRPDAADTATVKRIGRKAVVTGIRHWSTATYTRVAIDLGDGVTYEAARVPNPDRIYFDLHGTRLAQELVGKSFAVTDDGFLKKIRAAQYADDVTRVVLDVNDVTEYSAFLLPDPYRLIIDIHGRQAGQAAANREQGAASKDATAAAKSVGSASDVAAVSAMPGRVEATTKPTSRPISAVVSQGTGIREQGSGSETNSRGGDPTYRDTTAMDGAPSPAAGPVVSTKTSARGKAVDATPARAAVPTADGETSLVRALGLKIGRIVIDAGHGGHDSGTLGVDGLEEKDVVLDVALRLGKLLHDRLGAEIIYTRSDDTFIPLETRTAIANKAQADLFLSIHANSSSDATARGVETYYLNFTSDPSALETAARENAVSDQSIHQLSDLVKKIALKDKIAESREFATDVETSLYGGLQRGNAGLKDRGVKKAPFVVLIGANMPSVLAEISFVTNPKDAGQLRQPEYRQRVAESLYKGVAKYEGGLSGSRVATERAAE
jgi:N-acetylmuramoyl-L-alanine amidase